MNREEKNNSNMGNYNMCWWGRLKSNSGELRPNDICLLTCGFTLKPKEQKRVVSKISAAQKSYYFNVIKIVIYLAGISVSYRAFFLCVCLEFQLWGISWRDVASFSKLYKTFLLGLYFLMILTEHYCQEMFPRKTVLSSNV